MNPHIDDYLDLTLTTEISEEKDGAYAFKDTVFWGEKGGMLADRGTINGVPVTELKWEGDTLWHRVDGELSNPITMIVDRATRVFNTTVQSAFHLMDGYFRKQGNYLPAVGVAPGHQWFEINRGPLSEEEWEALQTHIDLAILADIPKTIQYIPGKEYKDPAYQDLEEVRVVSFGDLDTQPCGTLHVNHTGEIGSFVLLHQEKSSRGTKIFATVGPETARRLLELEGIVAGLNRILKTNETELLERVDALHQADRAQKEQIQAYQKEFAGIEAQRIVAAPASVVNVNGDGRYLRNVAQEVVKEGKTRLLYSDTGEGISFVIASGEGQARDLLNQMKEKMTIRGGGSPQVVNGQTALSVEEFLDLIDGIF